MTEKLTAAELEKAWAQTITPEQCVGALIDIFRAAKEGA